MGGLNASLRALLLCSAALVVRAEPLPVEVSSKLPSGEPALVRLQYRKGIQVEGALLPSRFLTRTIASKGWVAYEDLSPEGKRWVLASLFPDDVWNLEDVRHVVRWPELESVWLMASLYTGHGQNYDKLQAANPGSPEKLAKGDLWSIPRSLLSADLGGAGTQQVDRSQPEDDQSDEARVAAYRALLSYGEDKQGRYAAYHLRKGEALYSNVVMRYTDRVSPKEVNDLALVIARRSGIEEVRSIQPGTLVKIPTQFLADPFQSEGSTALREEREVREEVRNTARVDAGPRLKGVRIILDAGHGGVDVGAIANGVWESDFMYDITMRVRRILEQSTDATVNSTILYPSLGFKVRDTIAAPVKYAEILTTPPFANDGDSPNAVSVHLRWILANDWFSTFLKMKGEAKKTLFISFHADSLHPSARGTMVYVPGASGVPFTYSLRPKRCARVLEAKRSGKVSFTAQDRLRGEARSRLFAETLIKALKECYIPIHSNRPIRNVIHRGGKRYVPAVIRNMKASAKIVLETLNLTNADDAENLKDPKFRERYAEAVVKGILAYFRT